MYISSIIFSIFDREFKHDIFCCSSEEKFALNISPSVVTNENKLSIYIINSKQRLRIFHGNISCILHIHIYMYVTCESFYLYVRASSWFLILFLLLHSYLNFSYFLLIKLIFFIPRTFRCRHYTFIQSSPLKKN